MNFWFVFGVYLCIELINCQNNQTKDSSAEDFQKVLDNTDDDYSEVDKSTKKASSTSSSFNLPETVTTTEIPYFSEMPEAMKIVYIDPMTLLKFDNKGEKMMGVSDEKCDNGIVNIEADFDPFNKTEIDLLTKCQEKSLWLPDNATDPLLTIMSVPRRYIPIHKCTYIKIKYMEQIPTLGPHRPLWARYGEYSYLPTQRWLHNVEHGAIVGLYHPCADPDQIAKLKNLIKRCLFRHVITPYMNLTQERPIALVGWSASLEMSTFDLNLGKNFIKFYARTGPERVFRDGQYHHMLIDKAKYVTNVIDSEVCPGM